MSPTRPNPLRPLPSRARGILLLACGAVLTACSADLAPNLSVAPPGTRPAAVRLVAGDSQSAVAGTQLPLALVASAVDADGRPIRGQIINFRVTAGAGTVFAGAAATNDSGIARERWTLGTSTADSQRVEARAVDNSTGAPVVFGTFSAVALPGPATSVSKVGGDAQTGSAGSTLPESLSVRVTDKFGNPIAGESVNWSVGVVGDALGSVHTVTGTTGTARVALSLGTRLGTHAITAQRTGLTPASFTATAATPSNTVVTTTGDGQMGVVGTTLSDSLSATLKLSDGRPVIGAWVRWTTTGGALSPDSSQTNDAGVAKSRWTLSAAAGAATASAKADYLTAVSYSATATAGPPVSISRVVGSGQTAYPEQPLVDSLMVKVIDQLGNPVPNVTVSWAVTAGGGSTSPASTLTNGTGWAQTRWTVGSSLGPQSVTASATGPGSIVGNFTANPRLPATATITKIAGNAQTGVVNTNLADSLVVAVKLANGHPAVGVWVRWEPFNGYPPHGKVSPDSVRTDTSGVAKARWLLPTLASNGANTKMVEAYVGNLAPATFTATATAGSPAGMTITGGDGQYAPAGAALPVTLHVQVVDQFGNPANAVVGWTATTGGGHPSPASMSTGVSGIATTQWTVGPAGPQSMTATVTGVAPVVFHASNQPIGVVVSEPLPQSVGRPKVRVRASCDQPSRCDSIVVHVASTDGNGGPSGWRTISGGTFDDSVSLAAIDGRPGVVSIAVYGHLAGEHFGTQVPVYAESSPALTKVAELPGAILDVQADRILFVQDTAGRHLVKVRNRASGTDALVSADSGRVPRYGYLTPTGVMYVDWAEGGNSNSNRLREWQAASGWISDYGSLNSEGSLRVSGQYAIWSKATKLTRRDFGGGPTIDVSTSAGNTLNGVAANGDVAFWAGGRVMRYRGDTAITLSDPPGTDLYAVTDGINVVYTKLSLPVGSSPEEIWLIGPSGEERLSMTGGGNETSYRVNNGWVAFDGIGEGGFLRVWTRSPTGEKHQVTSAATQIDALGPNGEVVVSYGNRHSVAAPYTAVRDIGGSLGRPYFIDGNLYVALGRVLFVVP